MALAEAKTQALEEHNEAMKQTFVSRNRVLLTSNEDTVRQFCLYSTKSEPQLPQGALYCKTDLTIIQRKPPKLDNVYEQALGNRAKENFLLTGSVHVLRQIPCT